MTLRPSLVRSKIAITLTIEESLMSDTDWPVSGGSMSRIACGRITVRKPA